jgi:hypothetical protein
MEPDPNDPHEAWGVLNPASARGKDGELYLFPRVVAEGNYSRIGIARVIFGADGNPTGVERMGYALEPEEEYERSERTHGGVEDPRITWIPALGLYLMTYVAFGPLGPHPALATSADLASWERRGPLQFRFSADVDVDLNIYANKDCVFLDEPVTGPNGLPCLAMLHRPTWDLRDLSPAQGDWAPTGVDDVRGAIWISYVDLGSAQADPAALVDLTGHREVARSAYPFEAVKIVRTELGYFTNNAARMDYPTFRAQGLPIGSGAVESAAKHVVQVRMKRSGMRWSDSGGQAMLALCAYLASKRPLPVTFAALSNAA